MLRPLENYVVKDWSDSQVKAYLRALEDQAKGLHVQARFGSHGKLQLLEYTKTDGFLEVLHRTVTDGPASLSWHGNGNLSESIYKEDGENTREDGPSHERWSKEGEIRERYYFRNNKLHRHPQDGHAKTVYNTDGSLYKAEYYWKGIKVEDSFEPEEWELEGPVIQDGLGRTFV